jgi:endonuclease-3
VSKIETLEDRKKRAASVNRILAKTFPDARCELDYETPLQLLVATVLSAQCTDKRVNMVVPVLFKKYPDAFSLAKAKRNDLENIIKSTGFFRAKANSILGLSAILVEKYHGEVPAKIEQLVKLPGVGRKTANVVLGNAFNIPGITVDTHVGRITRRLGFTTNTDPVKVEHDLMDVFAKKDWVMWNHRLIFLGRRICHSRRPACGVCPLAKLCPSYGEGPTDIETASALAKFDG